MEQIINLRQEILAEHSKAQVDKIKAWVGDSIDRFNELFSLFLHDEYRVVQRAAWAVSYCVKANPDFIKDNFGKLLKKLAQPKIHDAVKRNSIRLLQYVLIPKKYHGAVMDICFRYVENPAEAVAIKVFSLTVLSNLAEQYPEIIPEIKLLIEDQLPSQTAGFKSRANALLKHFVKMNR